MKRIIAIFIFIVLLSCAKKQEIPPELKYSFEFLEKNWDSKEIDKFKNFSDNDTVPFASYHFGIGMYLRNNLLRHNEQSDSLVSFFNEMGIDHYDNMSGIVLNSFKRHLNDLEIDLEGQVNEILEEERPYVKCRNERKKLALIIYNKYKTNDSIKVKMPVDSVSNKRSVVSHGCLNSEKWKYDNLKDLLVNGIITEKRMEKDSFSDNPNKILEYYYFKMKILNINNEQTQYFMEDVKIGDEIEFSLEYSFDIK